MAKDQIHPYVPAIRRCKTLSSYPVIRPTYTTFCMKNFLNQVDFYSDEKLPCKNTWYRDLKSTHIRNRRLLDLPFKSPQCCSDIYNIIVDRQKLKKVQKYGLTRLVRTLISKLELEKVEPCVPETIPCDAAEAKPCVPEILPCDEEDETPCVSETLPCDEEDETPCVPETLPCDEEEIKPCMRKASPCDGEEAKPCEPRVYHSGSQITEIEEKKKFIVFPECYEVPESESEDEEEDEYEWCASGSVSECSGCSTLGGGVRRRKHKIEKKGWRELLHVQEAELCKASVEEEIRKHKMGFNLTLMLKKIF